MKTHPQIQARFLTHIDTETLLEVADSNAFRRKSERLLRAMILIELAYRLRMRGPWAAPAIWYIVLEHDAPPPPGLCSPSEAWPHERAWADGAHLSEAAQRCSSAALPFESAQTLLKRLRGGLLDCG